MELIGRIFGGIFDVLLLLFGMLTPGWSLFVISVLLGVLMLLLFKWVGNPDELELGKNRMLAHMMEMRLFDREPKLVFKAMGRLMWWNFRFFLATLKPMLVATAPMILLFVQMDHYYGYRPIRPGESAVVTARLADFEAAAQGKIELQSADRSVVIATPPVRSPSRRLVSWSIEGREQGTTDLTLRVGETTVSKSVTVDYAPAVVSLRRVAEAPDHILYPTEPLIDGDAVQWIQVDYPAVSTQWLGFRTHWLVWLFFISIFGALIVRWIVNAFRPSTL